HVARLLVGSRHLLLVPAAVLAGAVLVVGADVLRQVIDLGNGRLPVGVLTTLAGGPFFLWLLRRGGRHASM
ncbi:MAG TPA: iron chelate uptake ABC transporter family permease subunit, partial [Phycisphaerales bacterium]|nr:iron chelate uptake ABC transporter family permease subunit [Phycisphaerales bacterium]